MYRLLNDLLSPPLLTIGVEEVHGKCCDDGHDDKMGSTPVVSLNKKLLLACGWLTQSRPKLL